jgi:PhnO protein
MIREITHNDIDRVIVLASQLWPRKQIDADKMRAVIRMYIEDPAYFILGYEGEGTIRGFITVSIRWALFYQGKVAIIEDLIVDKSYRGQGLGYELVTQAEEVIMKDKLVTGIELCSDLHREETFVCWEKCGYERLGHQFRKELTR